MAHGKDKGANPDLWNQPMTWFLCRLSNEELLLKEIEAWMTLGSLGSFLQQLAADSSNTPTHHKVLSRPFPTIPHGHGTQLDCFF